MFIFSYKFSNYFNYFFNFYQIFSGSFNSKILAEFIIAKLKQKYPLFSIINPIVRDIFKFTPLVGFKILCSGRFSRKQIASYS